MVEMVYNIIMIIYNIYNLYYLGVEYKMRFCKLYRIKFFVFLCLLMLFCSCTRDPFGRYPDEVKDASPYPKNVYYLGHNFENQIVFESIATIEASDIWQTFVGDKFNMVVTGHVLLKDENFDDFHIELVSPPLDNEIYGFSEVDTEEDGSKKKQYIFRWQPSRSFLGEESPKVIDLRFRLTIVRENRASISRFDNFPVFVYEKPILTEPTILSIEHPSMVSSESICKIKVRVFDVNSSEDYPPVIDFVDVDRRYDASDLITFSNKSQLDDHTWEFEYNFKPKPLGGESQISYELEALAISKFGASSPSKSSQLIIFEDMDSLPQVIGPENITVYTGTTSFMELQVQDPFNGDLSLDRILNSENIPGHLTAETRKGNNGFGISITWDMPANTEEADISGEYELYVKMTYRWEHNGSRLTKKISHKIKISIIFVEDIEHPDNTQEIAIQ